MILIMADVSSQRFSKSKNNRALNKERHKERKHGSHYKENDIENDCRRDFRSNHKKDSPHKVSKQKSYDRDDRKHDDRNIHFTQPQEDRFISFRSNERNQISFAPSYRHDEDGIDEGYGNLTFNNDRYPNNLGTRGHSSFNDMAYDFPRTNDERSVTFNHSNTNNDECVASLWQKIDYLSNQVDVLTQENDRLKYSLNMRHNAYDEPHSGVTITFQSKDLEERFLPILTELASDLIQGRVTVDELRDIKFSKNNSPDDSESLKDLPEGELFQLDNSATEINESPRVPKYETSFTEILEDEEEKTEPNTKNIRPKYPKSCFNCGEDHVIGKCPYKIDYRRVANAKRVLKSSGPPIAAFYKRYHLNKEQGETGFKPGVLSSELREALALKKDQIPSYIYRMRLISYPPGWLEEARVESSGISVYDSKGSVLDSGSNGNVESTMNRSEIRYDPDKFVDYPGFNVPLPPDCIDESYDLGFPPMQRHQMRSYVEQNMPKAADIRPNRKRKLQLSTNCSVDVEQFGEDMDLDTSLVETEIQFTPPLPQELPPPPPPDDAPSPPLPNDYPEPPPEDSKQFIASHDSDSGANTPMSDSMEGLEPVAKRFKMEPLDSADDHSSSLSLKELEEMKKQLVMELGIVSECPSPSVQDDSQTDAEDLNSRGPFLCQDGSNELSSFSDCSFGSSLAENKQPPCTLQRSESVRSQSKHMTLGTPSLSRHSSYQKLPDYDKFSENVTSHINFENLPNSTGTYEKMKKVLKKVKEKFNALMP